MVLLLVLLLKLKVFFLEAGKLEGYDFFVNIFSLESISSCCAVSVCGVI